MPEKDQLLASKDEPEDETENTVFGLVIRSLTDEELESLELENGGLLVLDAQSGAAKAAGIRKGDVIQMINGEPVELVAAFTELMNDLPEGKFISILVQRSHGPEFLAMRIPEKEEVVDPKEISAN